NLDVGESASTGMLAELHKHGVGLHMDDFGIGTSWLRHLHSSDVDSVKIDRSFIAASEGADKLVLRRMVAIARDLGKKVIAEGVETAEQLRTVREVGCNAAQGFFFTTPLDGAKARPPLEAG